MATWFSSNAISEECGTFCFLRAKSKIYLTPLHIKLGLTKISVKVMHKESEEFDYLRQKFPQKVRPI
jgi:hypothetical protein